MASPFVIGPLLAALALAPGAPAGSLATPAPALPMGAPASSPASAPASSLVAPPSPTPPPSATAAADARFTALVARQIEAGFRRNPTWATSAGRHAHDGALEDYSLAGAARTVAALEAARRELVAVDPATLGAVSRADRSWLIAMIDGELFTQRELQPLVNDPDRYASGLAAAGYALAARDFAPAEVRLASLMRRLAQMPAVLTLARRQLGHPPRVATEIALDQIGGSIAMVEETLPAAFPGVSRARRTALKAACGQVATALRGYERWLRTTLLPRSTGALALGEARFRRKFAVDEGVDLPAARLIALGEAQLAADQRAMRAVAKRIDPRATLPQLVARVGTRHVRAERLIAQTTHTLTAIARFVRERDLLTLPAVDGLRVVETPAFMRATTTAAMDTPGVYETAKLSAFYYVTPPSASWSKQEREDYMAQWTAPGLANLTVHEAFPGHFVQDRLRDRFPSELRKVMWTNSNGEGWAHYCEQMMIEQGFHREDPWFAFVQLQEALLRDVRLVAGTRMHARGLTVAQATRMFEREAYQSHATARSEAWRATNDPTYGYYTLGKLMILKLRADYQRQQGAAYSLREFHDRFLALGPIPLPLAREAMLGTVGEVL